MSDVLVRIKRAVLAGRYTLTEKDEIELEVSDLMALNPSPFVYLIEFA